AQTARMYVFLVTSVAGFMTLVFEWERTQKVGYLIAAVVVMLIGPQFNTLPIFAAFIVLLPALLHGDRRRAWAGVIAFATILIGFFLIRRWTDAWYPQDVAADAGPVGNGPKAALIPHISVLWLSAATVPALLISWFVRWPGAVAGERDRGGAEGRARPGRTVALSIAVSLLGAGLVS